MKFKAKDVIYQGIGNGSQCTFSICKVLNVVEHSSYYRVKNLVNLGSIWTGKFNYKDSDNCLENNALATFEEAKKKLYEDMNISSDREFIKMYFERGQ